MLPTLTLLTTLAQRAPIDTQSFRATVSQRVAGKFVVALPEGYDNDKRKRWPLVLFLHGAGERGDDLQLVRAHGPLKEIAAGRKIPAIVVVPQCPAGNWWANATLTGLLNHVERRYRVDPDQVSVTGLSMGGFGTIALAHEVPQRFAAIAPICGGGNAFLSFRIAHIPAWIVHGDADPVLPVDESRRVVTALRRAGGKPRYDEVAGGGHDVWTNTYAKDEFWTWLLAQRRARG
jgi:predicted peptidase